MSTQSILFKTGPIVATPGAILAMERNQTSAITYLSRHLIGDWGELGHHDQEANQEALATGGRIFSAYLLPDETKLWVITDAEIDAHGHRYATTLLLPEEY
jgi:hypothetical protein